MYPDIKLNVIPSLIPSDALSRCWMDDDNLSLGLSLSWVGKSTSGVSDLGDGVTPVS